MADETTKPQDKVLWLAYFIIGAAVPLVAWKFWQKGRTRHHEIDSAHDITVEDSFPASDPPSAW